MFLLFRVTRESIFNLDKNKLGRILDLGHVNEASPIAMHWIDRMKGKTTSSQTIVNKIAFQ